MTPNTIRRLVELAYERGWRDACDDHERQRLDGKYPIGAGKATNVRAVLADLDPYDVLELQ